MKKAIDKTKKILKQYKCTFNEYMRDSGRRDDIDLGEQVSTRLGDGIVVGWNRSSNFDIFILNALEIINIHPNDVKKYE